MIAQAVPTQREKVMVMNMLLTLETNVDRNTNSLIDSAKIFEQSFPWDSEVQITNLRGQNPEAIEAKNISLYEHLILINDKPHVILRALSQREDLSKES